MLMESSRRPVQMGRGQLEGPAEARTLANEAIARLRVQGVSARRRLAARPRPAAPQHLPWPPTAEGTRGGSTRQPICVPKLDEDVNASCAATEIFRLCTDSTLPATSHDRNCTVVVVLTVKAPVYVGLLRVGVVPLVV